jgi:hypothetical protein
MAERSSKRERAAQRLNEFKQLVEDNQTYPLATITYHGPSPEKASKIVVGLLEDKDQAPILREWVGENIGEDVQTAREITSFVKDQAVARVITSEWVLSCPHEEGTDYPPGESCPHCPDWQ